MAICKNNLSPITNPANLNPYATPGLSDALKTMTSDTTNAVKGVYAGSGRDPSGAGSFAQSLGRGITQGEAPTIANAYQANVGNLLNANNSVFGAGNTTATGSAGLTAQALGLNAAGLGAAGSIPGLYTAPAQAQLGAAKRGLFPALLQSGAAVAAIDGPRGARRDIDRNVERHANA